MEQLEALHMRALKASLPLPRDKIVSIDNISPPTSVQARPFVIPIKFFFSISLDLNLLQPKNLDRSSSFKIIDFFEVVSNIFTTFLQTFEISFSKLAKRAAHYHST